MPPALSRLAGRPNVHFLGEKHGARVPAYLARFDVGLMPYRRNLETSFISPIKLYQYLAAGIPVVSTEIPATTGLRHLIRVAASSDDLAVAIDGALDEDDGDAREARLAFAEQNTWNQRVATILQIMQAALTAKRGEPKSLERRKRSGR